MVFFLTVWRLFFSFPSSSLCCPINPGVFQCSVFGHCSQCHFWYFPSPTSHLQPFFLGTTSTPIPHPWKWALNWYVCIAFLALPHWPRGGQQTKHEPIRFSLPKIRNWDPKSCWTLWLELWLEREPHSNTWLRSEDGCWGGDRTQHTSIETQRQETVRIPATMLWFPGSRPIATLGFHETVTAPSLFQSLSLCWSSLTWSLYSQVKPPLASSLLPLLPPPT